MNRPPSSYYINLYKILGHILVCKLTVIESPRAATTLMSAGRKLWANERSTWAYFTSNLSISLQVIPEEHLECLPEVGTELDGAVLTQEKSLPQF